MYNFFKFCLTAEKLAGAVDVVAELNISVLGPLNHPQRTTVPKSLR